MVRKLLGTTALATMLATGAWAQDAAAPAQDTPPAATPAMPQDGAAGGAEAPATDMQAEAPAEAGASTASISYLQALGADQYLATDLEGASLYTSNAADAETAGEIDSFVVDADGTAVAAVVDTGGFLDEDKTVAIPFDQIEWAMDENGDPRAVLLASREDLTAAPAFTAPDETAATGVTGGMAPATGGMAPAAGTDTAMAPAAGTAAAPAAGTDPAMSAAPDATGEMAAETETAETPAAAGEMQADAAAGGEYLATVGPEQYLSSDLIGEEIYSGATEDADNIGSVNDLVMASDGTVEAFLVGVGGFLGIGEKDVGVPFDNIRLMDDTDGEPRSILAATREQLTEAPAFETDAGGMAATTGSAGTAATEGGMAAGTAAGVAAGTAAGVATGASGATDAEMTASTGGTAPMADLTPVAGAELSADDLMGTNVYGPNNETIGEIGDIALTAEGQVDAVIVDVGGFLGIGAKPVAVSMENLQFMRDAGDEITLTTQFTQEQLENAPEYDQDTYAENRDAMLIQNAGDIPAAPAEADPAATTAPATDPAAPAATPAQ